MKEFKFEYQKLRFLNARCIGQAVKKILKAYPELKTKSIQDIKLQLA